MATRELISSAEFPPKPHNSEYGINDDQNGDSPSSPRGQSPRTRLLRWPDRYRRDQAGYRKCSPIIADARAHPCRHSA